MQLNDWQTKALELRQQGLSSRKICNELGWSKTKKSTINYFFARYDGLENGSTEKHKTATPISKAKGKILFFDIEMSLAVSYHFQNWNVNLPYKQSVKESHLLSHSWAWNDGEIQGSVLTLEEMNNSDPERLISELWALFDNADIVVAHNGFKFDVKKVNAMFAIYGYPPPSPYKIYDTLKVAKRKFGFTFNSLGYLAKALGVEAKDDTTLDLWIRCDKLDQTALDAMLDYNKQDVNVLRQVYYKLIGWDNQGVNMSLYNDEHDVLCTHCGSDDIVAINKTTTAVITKYQVYRCNSCNAVLRSNVKEAHTRNKLVRVI